MRFNHKGYLRVLKIIIPYFFVVTFFQLIGYGMAGIDLFDEEDPQGYAELAMISIAGMIGTIIIVMVWSVNVDEDRKFRFSLDKQGLKIGIIAPFLIVGMGFIILVLTNQIDVSVIGLSTSNLLLSVVLFICVSVSEELLMRYYVLRNLMISFKPWVALIISSLLFSLMHLSNPSTNAIAIVNLFLAGVFLGSTYIFNSNMTFPILGHFTWNFLQGPILGFNVSGKDIDSYLGLEINNKNLWNGGDFGFEGSVICTLFLMIGITYIILIYSRKEAINGRQQSR